MPTPYTTFAGIRAQMVATIAALTPVSMSAVPFRVARHERGDFRAYAASNPASVLREFEISVLATDEPLPKDGEVVATVAVAELVVAYPHQWGEYEAVHTASTRWNRAALEAIALEDRRTLLDAIGEPGGANQLAGHGATLSGRVTFERAPGVTFMVVPLELTYWQLGADPVVAPAGQSLQLVLASEQYAEWNDSAGVLSGGELVVRVAFSLDSLPGTGQYYSFAGKFQPGGTVQDRDFWFAIEEDAGGYNIRSFVSSNGTNSRSYVYWPFDTLSIDTAYVFEWTWDGSQSSADNEWALSIDDVDQGTPTELVDSGMSSIHAGDEPIRVGTLDGTRHYFDGRLDNFRYWSDLAKTQLELEYLFDGDATDSSGNGRDATEVNSPTYGDPVE